MMKFLVSIVASAVIMTAASSTATAIGTQKAVKEAPEAIKVNTESGSSESETMVRFCPPFCVWIPLQSAPLIYLLHKKRGAS